MRKWKKFPLLFITAFGTVIISGCSEKNSISSTQQNTVIQEELSEKSDIAYGTEIRADINGDGFAEKVYVKDVVNDDYAFTQVSAEFEDAEIEFKDYPDYWSSYLMAGDLTADGTADVLLMRFAIGSTYRGGEFSVLYMGENGWEEYPENFISNPMLSTKQPENFGDLSCIGAAIIYESNKYLLRIISMVDNINDTAECIDCSYSQQGWIIEDIQLVEGYFEKNGDETLLGITF